jgi:hypothetical protein
MVVPVVPVVVVVPPVVGAAVVAVGAAVVAVAGTVAGAVTGIGDTSMVAIEGYAIPPRYLLLLRPPRRPGSPKAVLPKI